MGEQDGADLCGLAREAGEWLMAAHRIDKATSGIVLLAKSKAVHAELARSFRHRNVKKTYIAIVHDGGLPDSGVIDLPLMTAGTGRVRVAGRREEIVHDPATGKWALPAHAITRSRRSYEAVTAYAVLTRSNGRALVLARPITGRRHQIRVHLAWIGHAVDGDPLFSRQEPQTRTHLHSWRIELRPSWVDDGPLRITALPDADFWAPLQIEGATALTTPQLEGAIASIDKASEEASVSSPAESDHRFQGEKDT